MTKVAMLRHSYVTYLDSCGLFTTSCKQNSTLQAKNMEDLKSVLNSFTFKFFFFGGGVEMGNF